MFNDMLEKYKLSVEDLLNTIIEVKFYINYNGLFIYYCYNDCYGEDMEYIHQLFEEFNKDY